MLGIGQAFNDVSWGILGRFFLAGGERGRGTRPRTLAGERKAVKEKHVLVPSASARRRR